MKYYTILDTNILVSFLLSSNDVGTINKLFNYINEGKTIPIYTDEIYEEYKEVLNRIKFNFESYKIGGLLNLIKNKGIKIKPKEFEKITLDPKDQIFYDAVMTKRDDDAYLVTGNLRHFPLKDFIVSAKQMLNIILNRYA